MTCYAPIRESKKPSLTICWQDPYQKCLDAKNDTPCLQKLWIYLRGNHILVMKHTIMIVKLGAKKTNLQNIPFDKTVFSGKINLRHMLALSARNIKEENAATFGLIVSYECGKNSFFTVEWSSKIFNLNFAYLKIPSILLHSSSLKFAGLTQRKMSPPFHLGEPLQLLQHFQPTSHGCQLLEDHTIQCTV